jgi:putative ATP-binding cassette transporter
MERASLKVTAARFARAARNLAVSGVGWKANGMFAALIALLCGANGLNVVNSFVGRNFMTAIADRDSPAFMRLAAIYFAVFAGSTIVAVIARFLEERLGLLWREMLTRRGLRLYLADGAYYRLSAAGVLAHPDQRIAEDIRAFTASTLSFVLMAVNSALTIILFSGVLWSISPLLLAVAVFYAGCGSFATFWLGRPLIRLNFDQLDKEASFRSELIHVRQNAEPILLAGREGAQSARLSTKLDSLVANFRVITSVNRKVGFFTTGYNWLIQIIPALIIAPAFFRREVEFGVITQSAMAFSTLVAAFSLVVTHVQALSALAAVAARLSSLMESIENAPAPLQIEIVEAGSDLAFRRLTLLANDGSPLLKDLSLAIPCGARVLVKAANEAAGGALFRAIAGVETAGQGRILRPPRGGVLFLPQQPYLPAGTLRQALGAGDSASSDERISTLLDELDLQHVLAEAGGLDIERNWGRLPLREQQQLALLAVLLAGPRFVVLDRPETALGKERARAALRQLAAANIGYVNIGEPNGARNLYCSVLELNVDGSWTWTPQPSRLTDKSSGAAESLSRSVA